MLKYVHSINVETVPIIIIKSNNNIVYKGAFDNEYIDLNKKQKISKYYVEDALNKVIQYKKIKTKKTKVVGCVIK